MNIVLLNGGLGNNLFQFAYGYSTFVESNLVFDWSAQKLLFSKSKSSLLECTMPKDVEVFNKGNSSLLFKICNMHLLHLLVTEKKSRVFPRMFFDWFLTKLVHQYLYFRYKDKVEIYLEGKKLTKHNCSREIKVHVGYFQTEKYSNRVDPEIFQDLFENFSKSAVYLEFSLQALSAKPLIIHIRIGDYRENPELGQLPKAYFINALSHLFSKVDANEIWIFSDSEELTDSYIPANFKDMTTIIPTRQLSPGQILKIMGLGNSFIISNSSFSWWAAYLRENRLAPVLTPTPWFAGHPWAKDLIPSEWEKIPVEFNVALEN
jgi:hypothetical protein